MFFIYVLRSIRNGKHYVGYTSKSAQKRLQEHNHGANSWTRTNKPLLVVYEEKFESKASAIRRERFLKSGQGRKYLDSFLK